MSETTRESDKIQVTLPGQLSSRLESVKDSTGLNKSEIARRGILDQISKLENSHTEGALE